MRAAVRIVVACLLGAVMTVVVAWGCATWAHTGSDDFDYDVPGPGERYGLDSRVPGDWVTGTWLRHRGFGIEYDWVSEMVWMGSLPGMMGDRQNRTFHRVAVGWPLHAMEWVCDRDVRLDPRGAGQSVWLRGFKPIRAGRIGWTGDRRLPVKPLMLGFAIDAAVYGVAVWSLIWGWRLVRAKWRVRGGRCPACGYDLAGLDGCPECGAGSAMVGS